MDAIKSLVQPLVGGVGGSSMLDGMKLVMLGGTVETARRVSSSAWFVSPYLINILKLIDPSIFVIRSHFVNCKCPQDLIHFSATDDSTATLYSILLNCPLL